MSTHLSPAVSGDTMLRFFDLIVDLYETAVAIHNDHVDGNGVIAGLSTALTSTIEQLRHGIIASHDAVLVRTVVKLGDDLLVRLTLVRAKSADLRSAWPVAAVEALSDRIQHLRDQWFISTSRGLPIRKLTQLRIPSANENNEKNNQGQDGVLSSNTFEQTNAAASGTGVMGKLQLELRPKQIQHGPPADLLEDFILDSLAYKSMHDREEEVAMAHGKTFEWIFEPKTDRTLDHQFTTWLTTDELGSIYWISGKPGSGKSTLMRFLFGHSSTMASLKTWAGDFPISTAGFFFWTSGSKEQRSQTGLLRYLLHQLLSENRTMMPKTFPKLWQKLQTLTTKERIKLSLQWHATELMSAFRSFLEVAVEYSKICLFVDGLDEFDGDQQELVRFFQSMGEGTLGNRIKMCLSSRPWAVFESSFESSVPNLKLQELTYQDLYHYVADNLGSDVRIGSCLKANEPFRQSFFEETVQRADGVFLWVRLTVAKILREFQASRGIHHLQTIIEGQPTELDELFEKLIFIDQDDIGISETATLFQLIAARETAASFVNDETANSLNVWELGLAIDPKDDALALSDDEVQKASDEEVQSRCENTCARIDESSMGLLSVFPRSQEEKERATMNETREENRSNAARRLAGHKVTYIHRTIRDWLMEREGVRERLISMSPECFDAHLRLLRAGVLALKLPVERPRRHRQLNDLWPQIVICMTHARNVQRSQSHLQRPFMDELDRTIGWYWIRRPADSSDHWSKHLFGAYEVRMKAPPMRKPYLCLVTNFGIADYIAEELESLVREDCEPSVDLNREGEKTTGQDEFVQEDGEDEEEEEEQDEREPTPLLSYATEYICSRNQSVYPLSSPSFVASLLRHPSRHNPGPNHIYTGFFPRVLTTPWVALLQNLRRAHRRGWIKHLDLDPQGTSRWTEIVRLFLYAGADVDAVVAADWGFPETSALGVLEMFDEAYCATEVKELMEWAAGRRRTLKPRE